MALHDDEERQLRAVALQNASAILAARQRAEEELVRAKEALERSLAMMRATLESTTDGILVTDAEGIVTDFNERFLALWRLPREAVASAKHARLVETLAAGFTDGPAFSRRIDEIYATAPRETFDVLELSDGRVVERYSRTQIVDGRDVGRVWSFRDISVTRRSEEALREETRVLDLLNRTGTVLSSKLELPDLVQAITDAGTELSGARFGAFFYNVTERGESYMLFALSGARREDFERFGQPRATPLFGPTFRGEGPIRCDDVLADPRYGRWQPHHGMPPGHLPVRSYLATPVISRSGEVLGGLFFGHPDPGVFTERAERLVVGMAAQAAIAIDNARMYEAAQAARRETERASAMKDEFLATLSHELRTPLNAILGWAQMVRMPEMGSAEQQRGLEIIERNARVQTQLVEDLLDMSRITSGTLRLDVQSVMPAAILEAAIDTVRAAANARGIELATAIDAAAGPVAADPARLQQIAWNLLSNAIKFTGRHGRVVVRLARVGAHVEISVEDTGIGIAPEFLPHVFDRFRQADGSITRAAGGLGLGLSIVKQLVELHGGSVRAASAGTNAGATFTVELPLGAARTPARAGA